jgi:hypothetical protein
MTQLRAIAIGLAAACAGRGLYDLQIVGAAVEGWWLLLAAIVLAGLAHIGLRYPVPEPAPPPEPPEPARRWIGVLLAAAGALVWALATRRIYRDWIEGFDLAWIGWSTATVLLAVGLDLAWGRWPRPPARRWPPAVLLAMGIIVAAAAVYRLGNIKDFPGEAAITQIEDLQVGNFGWAYMNGYRLRWEYLSSTWLAALGIWLGGPSQFALRVPFAVVSVLKVLPLFVWLRLSVGTAGALVGTALLASSFWDVTLSRIPNNHNALVVSIVFALLAGPARRGRPSAYVLLGFFSAYILHEYIAYRPLEVIALAGAVLWSLRDRGARWPVRVARPLITVLLLATMTTPLFFTRLRNTFYLEYFDGWNRARGIAGYYNPEDTWQQTLLRRWQRASAAAELFTLRGDSSPVRNVAGQPPLIDPVTCALLLLGIGGALAHLLSPVLGLTLFGLVVTVSGTLILTGNFDVARVGGAVPYVYALAGFGAAGLWTAWSAAWGRAGRVLAAILLAAGVGAATYWCTGHLRSLWTDPIIRRAHRSNLAYLTVWLRDHVQPSERVLGITPGYTNVLQGHDGSWLRGREMEGYVGWDIESALRQWEHEAGPTLLFVFAGASTEPIAQYLSTLFPGLQFQFDADPVNLGADVAYARLPGPPPEMAQRLADWRCRGVHGEFSIIAAQDGALLFTLETVAPFICKSTWPAAVPDRMYRLTTRASGIRVRYSSPFTVAVGGDYLFALETYAGNGTVTVDGARADAKAVQLAAGLHTLEVHAQFAPMAWEPVIRLLWSGPDTANRQELMPFYRLAPIDPSCAEAAGQAPFAALGAGRRAYLTDWLARGPFDNRAPAAGATELVDVAQLAADPRGAAAEPGWAPVPARGAFVDLDSFYAPAVAGGNPEWTCAYAVTTIASDAAQRGFLELAGSGDALSVWLNGNDLTPSPIHARYDPMHRPIDLRAGENLLVVKSCEDVGAWYFVARITDAGGRDLPNLRASAALPSQPIPPAAPAAEEDAQVVEGFGSVTFAAHSADSYGDYRGGGPSAWAYVEDPRHEVVWRTGPIPERKPTILAVTASSSPENGDAELYVNGQLAVAFPIGTQGVGGRWSGKDYRVAFVSKGFFAGNSGLLLISVPAEAVTPGEPLELRVALTGGAPRAWFMIKSYPDTVAKEAITARAAEAQLHSLWRRAPVGEVRVGVRG